MAHDGHQRPRAGLRTVAWGAAAVVIGLLLFAASAVVALAQGHPFAHLRLLGLPLALVLGGLTAMTAGGVSRLVR